MAVSRDFANAATDAYAACAQYLLQVSVHGATTLHLHEQVIGCVARRQLTPDMLRETLMQVVQRRGAESVAETTALAAQLVAALAASRYLPAGEAAPPAFDPADPIAWFRRLGAYMAERNASALADYQAQLLRLAAGDIKPAELRKTMSAFYKAQTAEELGRLACLWFELLRGIDDLQAAGAHDYLRAVLAQVRPRGFDGDVLDLTGPLGETTSAVMVLENTRDERTAIRCTSGDVRRADGVGPAFTPAITIVPTELSLERDAEAAVQFSLRLDAAVYEAGAPYIGLLQIDRDGESRVDVPLRITASARDRR